MRAAGVYLVAAVALTWPLATQLTGRLGALEGAGDPYLNLWILGTGMKAWLADPMSVWSGRVFDANIFHPAAGSLTFSDHLLLQSLVMAPLYAVTGNLALCYNVLLLVSIAASGLAMHALVKGVTGSVPAAFVAGLAWACWPYRTAHLLHLQLQALYFLPLALLLLYRLAAARRAAGAAWLGLVAALQAVSSVYYGVMTAVVLATGAVVVAWTSGQWRGRRFWSRVFLAAAAGAVIVAPVAWPYWQSQQREGFGRNLFEAAAHAASIQSYTQVPPDNLIYGRTGVLAPRAPAPGERDRRHVEHQMFPGLVILGLAALGLWRGWKSDARPVVVSAAALAVLGFVLSLGPEGVRWFYAWMAEYVFGFQAIRASARFSVILMLGLCVLAGVGVAQARWRRGVIAGVIAVMCLEYANAPLAFVAPPPVSTASGRWLADEGGSGAVVYLPLTLDRENSPFMVQSLEHGRPIVNGYSGQRPSFYTSLVDALADPASADARATLKELDVRFVVSPATLAGAGEPASPFVERVRFDEAVIYELVWTPESEAALDEVAMAEPPPPGNPPFSVGERAAYDVQWLNGPLDLTAGQITLSVVAPEAKDLGPAGEVPAWVFDVAVETAPWVSRFFEARDRFRTAADAELKPLLHQRELREGRRSVDRAYAYDHAGRKVGSGDSPAAAREVSALSLPLPPGARDALSALWYIRTMPLAPGYALAMPLNEAGRNLALTVTVPARETIEIDGAPVAALRVEPRFTARVQRREAIESTIWLSDDARRVPLLVEVAAGFGRVRLKLVDYRP
ncbi:MAG: DUF3108 domain-containing protein [Vicinamibacterales bacterium]